MRGHLAEMRRDVARALLDIDGGVLTTLSPGWQLEVPWADFLLNPYFGGAVESAVEPPLTFDSRYFEFLRERLLDEDDGAKGRCRGARALEAQGTSIRPPQAPR
jgi:hypothetical protein